MQYSEVMGVYGQGCAQLELVHPGFVRWPALWVALVHGRGEDVGLAVKRQKRWCMDHLW